MIENVKIKLKKNSYKWLVTGVAGFIGSNLLEALLNLGQFVVGLDNFSTGHRYNLDEVRSNVGEKVWGRFTFIEGDICNIEDCRQACMGVKYVLHQAALVSVPRSIEDPIYANANNIDGFLNMMVAARDGGVKRFVYAASSATYGDQSDDLPKMEDKIGNPLSPYAVTKLVNELYADVFARIYGFQTIGLRYFNIFGKRQDPNGAYAAVIPKWITSMIKNEPVYINGDGETSRDFCYIDNAVQANLLAATTETSHAINQIYNVAVGDRTTLNQLYDYLTINLMQFFPHLKDCKPVYRDFRTGDIQHSLADISKAVMLLGYKPTHDVCEGLKMTIQWYIGKE